MSRRKKPKACEGYNYHHRKPKKLRGSGCISSGNLSLVLVSKHRAWHRLFETKTPEQIAITINSTWLDPAYELVVRKKA